MRLRSKLERSEMTLSDKLNDSRVRRESPAVETECEPGCRQCDSVHRQLCHCLKGEGGVRMQTAKRHDFETKVNVMLLSLEIAQ
jgi:hypothetical protein